MRKFGGTWSKAKLDCVEDYARTYLNVMQNQNWCRVEYVDAFAGRGKQALNSAGDTEEVGGFFGDESERADTEDFLTGSAIRALTASGGAARPFDRFLFIDADQASCTELQSVVNDDFTAVKNTVQVVCGDANTALGGYLDSVDWSSTRALVFLDPYGLEVDWSLVCRLAATGACDVWYLFPLGGVIRMMTNDGHIPDAWAVHLDRLFGTHDWFEEFYQPNQQQSLFDLNDELLLKDASTRHVVNYIRQRLGTVFPAVSDAAVLRNGKSAPLFALVLGISNTSENAQRAGMRIANHLVKDLSQL